MFVIGESDRRGHHAIKELHTCATRFECGYFARSVNLEPMTSPAAGIRGGVAELEERERDEEEVERSGCARRAGS